MAPTAHTPANLPATMRGMEISGGTLTLNRALPLPTVKPGELLIKTAYTGINRADLMQMQGKYPPPDDASPLPGLEISGTIAALGDTVQNWNIGDKVCALLSGGGYADYVAAPATQVLAVPKNISLKEAACLPEAAATSAMALGFEAGIKPGERVLIHGGTSGLGLIMTQIAKALGAEVYTTVGSDKKIAFLAPFGLHAINHRTTPFAEQIQRLTNNEGIDIIIDTLGGPEVGTHFSLLRRGGRMVSLAMMNGPALEPLKMTRLLTHQLRWSGATLRSRTAREKAHIMAFVAQHVWPHVASGAIRPVVDSVFPLDQAEKALHRMQERLHLGKILLEVAPK